MTTQSDAHGAAFLAELLRNPTATPYEFFAKLFQRPEASSGDKEPVGPSPANIRAAWARQEAEIKSRTELTQVAKNALLAKAFKAAKAQMKEIEVAAAETRSEARAKNTRTAFGLEDLASTPAELATLSMAHRAAAEKVAAVTDPAEGARLLAQAHAVGDETMARAVAAHANTMYAATRERDWGMVLNDYATQRPAAFEAIEALHEDSQRTTNFYRAADMFEFVLPTPSELGRASDYDLDRLIAQDPFAQGGDR